MGQIEPALPAISYPKEGNLKWRRGPRFHEIVAKPWQIRPRPKDPLLGP